MDDGCSELKKFEKEYRLFKEESLKDENSILSLESKEAQSEQDAIADMLQNGSVVLTLATFFGFGLLLAFTPCMLPVIPILSAVIISKKDSISTKQGFLISLTYVVSMSVVYALAGVLAASLGSNIQAFFQQTWIIVTVSSLFFILSLAMFGTFTIQMPKKIQSFLNDRALWGRDKSYYSVVLLGVLSALIVGPCVAPPLAGALIYIGQSGNELLGGMSLFLMSLGMGVPLLMLGAGAGKFLPKPGIWMEDVKLFFGFTMIAFSIWLLSRILEAQTILLLWGVLLVAVAIFMNPFENIKSVDISRMQQLKKLLSMLALIYGVVLIVGAIGGAKSIK
ncbi:MAG TPA: cytochrome c biogenesis protein CcdA, partial [Sulfurimonas sp.]